MSESREQKLEPLLTFLCFYSNLKSMLTKEKDAQFYNQRSPLNCILPLLKTAHIHDLSSVVLVTTIQGQKNRFCTEQNLLFPPGTEETEPGSVSPGVRSDVKLIMPWNKRSSTLEDFYCYHLRQASYVTPPPAIVLTVGDTDVCRL